MGTGLIGYDGTMSQSSAYPSRVTVLIGNDVIGIIEIRDINQTGLRGTLKPESGFEPYRKVFEAAIEATRRFEDRMRVEVDYVLWDQMIEAFSEIHRLGLTIAEIPRRIEEVYFESSDWYFGVAFNVFKEVYDELLD